MHSLLLTVRQAAGIVQVQMELLLCTSCGGGRVVVDTRGNLWDQPTSRSKTQRTGRNAAEGAANRVLGQSGESPKFHQRLASTTALPAQASVQRVGREPGETMRVVSCGMNQWAKMYFCVLVESTSSLHVQNIVRGSVFAAVVRIVRLECTNHAGLPSYSQLTTRKLAAE